MDWLLKNHRSLIDAEYVLNADAGGVNTEKGKPIDVEIAATEKLYADFELTAQCMLIKGKGFTNSGIQYRSKVIEPREWTVAGYQADMGEGYWGSLYDESRRNKTLTGPTKEVMDKIVKFEDWNDYVIRCEGPRIRLWLNGTLTVDYTETDNTIERTGIIGLQIHGGGKAKALYKDITIEELGPGR